MNTRLIGVLVVAVCLAWAYALSKHKAPSIVEKSQAKVVNIAVPIKDDAFIGSGAIISPDGLILTCAHLFSDPGQHDIYVKTRSGQTYLARIVRVDHTVDLAVLKIDALEPLPYFTFGNSPYVGQFVMAMGSPLNLQGTVTFGYIENINQPPSNYTIQGCPTNSGNSGGPLVDREGRLIGINTAVLLLNPFQIAQGLGRSVNLDTIRDFVRL